MKQIEELVKIDNIEKRNLLKKSLNKRQKSDNKQKTPKKFKSEDSKRSNSYIP